MAKDKLTPKQNKYCEERTKGKSQRQAYKAAYDVNTMQDKTIDEAACRLESDSKISARLQELRERDAAATIATRDDIAKALSDIALSPDASEGIRLKAFDQLSRIIGAYDDRQTIDVKAAVLTGRDKADAIRDFLSGMTDGKS